MPRLGVIRAVRMAFAVPRTRLRPPVPHPSPRRW